MLEERAQTPNAGATMKVTIEINCTPVEARQFMGLPDLQPMQAAVMAEIEKRVTAEAAKFSPDDFLRAWFTEGQQGAERLRDLFRDFFAQAAGSSGGEPDKG
jgi:hypothetical protein